MPGTVCFLLVGIFSRYPWGGSLAFLTFFGGGYYLCLFGTSVTSLLTSFLPFRSAPSP